MTTSILPECPTFRAWYRDVNGRDPFPWQERLANQVAAGSEWPGLVGIPTGLGKTACIDIAIWALAYQAHLRPQERNAPTRIWWVVNRRLLVDDTYIHAESVAKRLARSQDRSARRCCLPAPIFDRPRRQRFPTVGNDTYARREPTRWLASGDQPCPASFLPCTAGCDLLHDPYVRVADTVPRLRQLAWDASH